MRSDQCGSLDVVFASYVGQVLPERHRMFPVAPGIKVSLFNSKCPVFLLLRSEYFRIFNLPGFFLDHNSVL